MARLARLPCADAPPSAQDWLEAAPRTGRHLLLLDAARHPALYGDPEAWGETVQGLDARWFAPLEQALRRGRVGAVELVGGDGLRWSFGRADRWRLWRRRRPLGWRLRDEDERGGNDAEP
jgi:hypothetical protein